MTNQNCPAAAHPRVGVLLSCHREPGHPGNHYDFLADADWRFTQIFDALTAQRIDRTPPVDPAPGVAVFYRIAADATHRP